ncbi:MAG TPA: DUF2520 domain-containing protein [Actinobacteria bacterium]|nr:Rossmann-like domain protein [bacterium BMS3Bbin01]HDH25425.1 DUF2520 domain-containing protein [Actinomycetota bacterium]
MNIILAGPGRAGTALCLAAASAGHRVVAVLGRRPEAVEGAAARFDAVAFGFDDDLPAVDLLMVAVRDDAIEEVADRLAPRASNVGAAVHLSGLKPAAALAPLADAGLATGVLHPLQTLPTPEAGAEALPGSWFAVTAHDPVLRSDLEDLVASIGGHPFALDDEDRALYHAAAATAANDTVAVLALAANLFAAAGVPFDAARPLVEAVVANAFRLGPKESLTGPIARGDVGTVVAQLQAVADRVPEEVDRFRRLGRVVAELAGTRGIFEEIL